MQIAIIIGAVAAAVTLFNGNPTDSKKNTESNVPAVALNQSWTFNGGPNDSPLDSTLYSPGAPSSGCIGTETVCELFAPDNGSGYPNMSAIVPSHSQTVRQRIEAAITDEEPNETASRLKN